MDRLGFFWKISFGCLLVLGMAGCGSSDGVKNTPASFHRLSAIGRAYYQATEEFGRPPKNKEEIIPFLKKEGDPAELLRSSVDNQDFVINWGIDYRKLKPTARYAMVTAYEKEGQKGNRYVLRFRLVKLMGENELTKMTFPPGAERP